MAEIDTKINALQIPPSGMRIATISYGAAIIIIAAIVHYLVLPGIENCSSMSGIVASYTSEDYSLGCGMLSDLQVAAIATEVAGSALTIIGILQKPRVA